jgi:TolA-binding protein
MLINAFLKFRETFYEGEGGEGGDPGAGGDPAGGTGGEKTLTQAQVNAILAKERENITKKFKTQNQELVGQLEQLRQNTQMTEEQKTELESRIEMLQTQYLTKEEQARRDQEKAKKQYEEQLTGAQSESKQWRSRYENAEISRAISDAASEHKAVSAFQIAAILKPLTRIVETLDADGKPSGSFAPRVKFNDVDAKGNPVELDLSVSEAVKAYSEKDEFANLFQDTRNGGVGAGKSTGRIGKLDPTKLNGEQWLEARKKNKEAFYESLG